MKLHNVSFPVGSLFNIYFIIYNYWNVLGVDSGDTIRVPEAGNSGERESQPGNLIIKLKAKSTYIFLQLILYCKCNCTLFHFSASLVSD